MYISEWWGQHGLAQKTAEQIHTSASVVTVSFWWRTVFCGCLSLPNSTYVLNCFSYMNMYEGKQGVWHILFYFLQILPNQLNLVRNIRSIVSEQVLTVHVYCNLSRGTAAVLLYCMCTAVHRACTVDLALPWHCAVLPVLYRVLWLSLVLCPALEARDNAFAAPKLGTYWERRWDKWQNIMDKPAYNTCQHIPPNRMFVLLTVLCTLL